MEPFDSNCPITYHPKQYLFAMSSPGFPDTVDINETSTKSVPIRRTMAPPERCIVSETFFKSLYCPTDSLEIFLALLQGLVSVHLKGLHNIFVSGRGKFTRTSTKFPFLFITLIFVQVKDR